MIECTMHALTFCYKIWSSNEILGENETSASIQIIQLVAKISRCTINHVATLLKYCMGYRGKSRSKYL